MDCYNLSSAYGLDSSALLSNYLLGPKKITRMFCNYFISYDLEVQCWKPLDPPMRSCFFPGGSI